MNPINYLVFTLVLLSGCIHQGIAPLDFSTVQYKYQTPDCEPETDACLMVNLSYPNFDQGDSVARHLANRIIRNSILDNIGMGNVESEIDPSIGEAVDELNQSFSQVKKDYLSYGIGWQAEVSSSELFRSDTILVVEMNSMTFFGGAHPNHGTRYFNFNRKKGNMMPLSTFIKDIKAFTTKAEALFKEQYHIDKNNTYQTAGFNFLGNRFILSANYAFLGDSIRLHYNPYEIAPYSMGDFEITVSIK